MACVYCIIIKKSQQSTRISWIPDADMIDFLETFLKQF